MTAAQSFMKFNLLAALFISRKRRTTAVYLVFCACIQRGNGDGYDVLSCLFFVRHIACISLYDYIGQENKNGR